jgi:predicted Zn-dependent peptidase
VDGEQDGDAPGLRAQGGAGRGGTTEPEYIAELERLAQLRQQGIVSEEEFQAKKKQLLGI